MSDKKTTVTREALGDLISGLALEAYGANSSQGGYYPPRVPPNTTDMKAARAEVNAALDALFARLDAQETALVAADAMRAQYTYHGVDSPQYRGVLTYDTARKATKDEALR